MDTKVILSDDQWSGIAKQFKEPFPTSEMSVRVGSTSGDKTKGQVLPYIDARCVMERLDEVVGAQNWEDRYQIISATEVLCVLTVHGVSKSDVGQSKEDKEGEVMVKDLKAACSDAFKRAAVKWGIGQYLYSLPRMWEPLNEKKHFERKEEDIIKDLLAKAKLTVSKTPTSVPQEKTLSTAPAPTTPAPTGAGPVPFSQEQRDKLNTIKKALKAEKNAELNPFIEKCFEGKYKLCTDLNGNNADAFITYMANKFQITFA